MMLGCVPMLLSHYKRDYAVENWLAFWRAKSGQRLARQWGNLGTIGGQEGYGLLWI